MRVCYMLEGRLPELSSHLRQHTAMSGVSPAPAVSVALAEPQLDGSLAADGELARECPQYVDTVSRALSLAAEGFADVRHPLRRTPNTRLAAHPYC